MKQINMEKLVQYVADGSILEFESDQECMDFFKVSDHQYFKSIKEMKEYQGKFGFNIDKKRYHILIGAALDVYIDMEQFTNDELYILSGAMLQLMRSTNQALKLTYDKTSIEALQNALKDYQELNSKVCRMLE